MVRFPLNTWHHHRPFDAVYIIALETFYSEVCQVAIKVSRKSYLKWGTAGNAVSNLYETIRPTSDCEEDFLFPAATDCEAQPELQENSASDKIACNVT
jgi:hypothetical protein